MTRSPSSPLRISIVVVGMFMVVYSGGGVAASALSSGLRGSHTPLIAGAATGLLLLTWSTRWSHPIAARAALAALGTAIAAALLSIPAILLLGTLAGGPLLETAMVAAPLAWIGGLLAGGAAVLLHERRGRSAARSAAR